MTQNTELINSFYSAFQIRNAQGMIDCYANSLKFRDPAFGKLNYEETSSMWKMLCLTGKDLVIEFEVLSEEEDVVKAFWDAKYTFSRTGRKVHNKINATFIIEDGLIISHVDTFNLHSWAAQALGWKGFLFGWTKFFRNKLNLQTKKLLDTFMNK